MRRAIAAILILGCAAAAVFAQKTTQLKVGAHGSPHVRSEYTIQGAKITLEYGRPSLKGRPLAEAAPLDKVMPFGDDEATTITFDKALMFGMRHIEPGKYTLYAEPGDEEWHLIISKQTGQPASEYHEDQNVARIPMDITRLPAAVDQFTLTIEPKGKGGMLITDWGTTRASTFFYPMGDMK